MWADEISVLGKGKAVDPPVKVIPAAPAQSTPAVVTQNTPTARPVTEHVPMILTSVRDESVCDVVYTDGACPGNGKPGSLAGIGVWWGPNDQR